MNVTPALPNPYQPPASRDSKAVTAVRASNPPRDPVGQAVAGKPLAKTIELSKDERALTGTGASVVPHRDGSGRTSRALASYAEVAEIGESGRLRELLGFDAYA